MLGWDKYPIALPHSVRWVDDVYNMRERLEQNCESLFVSEASKIQLEVSIQGISTPTKSRQPTHTQRLINIQRKLSIYQPLPTWKSF
jgi:hypothetical protein